MSKRKKRPSKLSLQKIRQLQHKNEFAKRLKGFVIAYVGKEAAALLTNHRIDEIYRKRTHTLKLNVAEGSVIDPQFKKHIESFVLNRIKEEKITAPNGSEISFSDYLTVGLSLCFYIDCENKSNPNGNNPFNDAFAGYKDLFYSGEDANHRLYRIADLVCFIDGDLGSHHYWIEPTIQFFLKDDDTIMIFIEMHRVVPEKTIFTIGNQTRPAFKLGWAQSHFGVKYPRLRPSELGIKENFLDIPLDIYIQSHALQRLSERLDCMSKVLVHFFVIASVCTPLIAYDTLGRLLIEYRIAEYKAGYLRADIVNGCILIRTFLFLTNNGTPEGQKLEEMTGLGKLDKKYLAIDKLSAFMSSDIRSNESVMQLLHKSGCECLLDLHQNLKKYITNKNKSQATGALMSRYLELDVAKEQQEKTSISKKKYGYIDKRHESQDTRNKTKYN